MISKIALGTVQFGLDYGIANLNGKIPFDEVKKILTTAISVGISTLDTARGYGNSEEVLGSFGIDKFQVISKLPGIDEKGEDWKTQLNANLRSSFNNLKTNSIYGLLLHRPSDLFLKFGSEYFNELQLLKEKGLVQKIGISVYDQEELDHILKRFKFDIVQLPMNVFDRRFLDTGWLEKLKTNGNEIHTRSAFLQGLLLMDRSKIPIYFEKWSYVFDRWNQYLKEVKYPPLDVCLSFIFQCPYIDKVVLGVDNFDHLSEIIKSSTSELKVTYPNFKVEDLDLLIPSNWKLSTKN